MALLMLGVTYFYLDSHLKSFLEKRLQEDLRHGLSLSKDILETELSGKVMSSEADRLADRFGRTLGVRATIIGLDGTVLGDSELDATALAKVENHLDRPEIQQALRTGFGQSERRYSYTVKKYMLYMAVPLGKEKPIGILRFAIPITYIEFLEAGMVRFLVIAVGISFIVAFALSYIISIIISKPLIKMTKTAEAIANNDFSAKVPARSRDEMGDLARSLNFMADEIKRHLEKISSGEAQLESVLSGMAEGVIVTDAKGNIVLANPSARKMFFIDTPPEGRTPIEVARNSAVQNMIDKVLKEKQRLATAEILLNAPEEIYVKVNSVPIMKAERIEGAILVFHDITELRRLERIRQDFVANVSHELRTPLSSIKGYAETLYDGKVKDAKEQQEFLGIVYRESDRLAKLIDDLLDLSKIESGRMSLVLLPVDLGPLANRTRGVVEKLAREKSIKIDIEIPPDLPKTLADERRISQVLLNLLDNAIKYTPDGGSVKVSAFRKDDFVQVDVSDTGVGIPEPDLYRIFERFYRVDKGRSRELGGTGLGLSIVKHIVQAHGGQVWVKSEAGRGSTFSFTVPKA
jgi:two-component system phosphate regulon sensor histidine kinase PhoR